MSSTKKPVFVFVTITLIFVCTMTTFLAYGLLASWAEYEPKEAAIESVIRCLDAENTEQQEACGLIPEYLLCWNAIEEATGSNDEYSVEVIWYNWEDRIPNRGGDEVYLQITFADGKAVKILWYEGVLEYCEVESH